MLRGGAGQCLAVQSVFDERVRAGRPISDLHGARIQVDDEGGIGHGPLGHRQAFVCGPPKMIEATMKVLEEKRLSKDRIFYDEF